MNKYIRYTVTGLCVIGVAHITLDVFDGVVDEAKQSRAIVPTVNVSSTAFDATFTVARAPTGEEVQTVNARLDQIGETPYSRST